MQPIFYSFGFKISSFQVYLNALGLMLRLFVRGEFDPCEGRLKILANVLTDKVS